MALLDMKISKALTVPVLKAANMQTLHKPDKNIAINTKNGEYFIPVDAKDVFELRKCIDKEIKNSSQK